jgi:hypothetical protein
VQIIMGSAGGGLSLLRRSTSSTHAPSTASFSGSLTRCERLGLYMSMPPNGFLEVTVGGLAEGPLWVESGPAEQTFKPVEMVVCAVGS